jgi:carboxyl-terminal processing protease
MKANRSVLLISLVVLWCAAFSPPAQGPAPEPSFSHPGILSHTLRHQLESNHFSGKKFDDGLSRAAFDLYLKQLDPQKLFLLREDIEKISAYAELIDDEMKSGKIGLPFIGVTLLRKRVAQVRPMVKDLLSKDFDFAQDESLETDPDKREPCRNDEELRERWRKVLKYQVLSRYLTLLEERSEKSQTHKNGKEDSSSEALLRVAHEKVMSSYDTFFSRLEKENEKEVFDRYFSAVARAFDPHTEYMPPASKDDFDIHMKGSLEGIGALLREEDGYIKVDSLVPGGPAALQGQLNAGDRILKVGEGGAEPVDLTGSTVREAVKLIRGKKGTIVKLTVLRQGGGEIVIPITRDVVQIEEAFAKGALLDGEGGRKPVGYISLPSFYRDFGPPGEGGKKRNSTDDVREILKRFKPHEIRGLVLDLRNNGGGALTDAVGIAGLFIKTGPIVQIKNSKGGITLLSDDDADVAYAGPMVVLVNRHSASASEILAGALQDYGRAVILGSDHTFGKGTVQSLINLESPPLGQFGALKVTIQKFYRVSGESTQHRGIVPDIFVPDPSEGLKSGERYLDNALPWDRIPPVSHDMWGSLNVSSLKSKSAERVQADKDFVEIASETKKLIERQDATLQSLNIGAVRKEREAAKYARDKMSKSLKVQSDDEKKAADAAKLSLSDEEKLRRWTQEVSEDPYVKEGIAVISDLLNAETAQTRQ